LYLAQVALAKCPTKMRRLMKIIRKTVFLIAFFVLLALLKTVQAEDFSADVISKSKEGTLSGKMYVSKDRVRMEMPGAVTITKMDEMAAYILMPEQKIYMEQKIDPSIVASTAEKLPGETGRTFVANETVDGRNTKKYRVSYKSQAGNAMSIPVKTADVDGKWSIEFSSIVTGSQNNSLFEIPEGYTKFTMPNMDDMMKAAQQTVVDKN
jgi:hypothetical protein